MGKGIANGGLKKNTGVNPISNSHERFWLKN